MRRSSNITDFFKPYAQASQKKRPLPRDDPPPLRATRPTLSATLQAQEHEAEQQEKNAAVPDNPVVKLVADSHEDALNFQYAHSNGAGKLRTKPNTCPSTVDFEFSSSQSAVLTSSQRIIRKGQVMIRSSEDEASDSDSSLENIDALLAPKEDAEVPSSPTKPEVPIPNMESKHSLDASRTKRKLRGTAISDYASGSPALPVIPNYKFSLGSLVKQSRKFEESESQAAKARSLLQSLEQQANVLADRGTEISDSRAKINKILVATVMKQDREDEDVGKLMTAIKRTEALYQEKYWSFFDGDEDVPRSQRGGFPQVDQLDNMFYGGYSKI